MSKLINRRRFLMGAAALAAPIFIPASALGAGGRPSPSNRLLVGAVGVGWVGGGNLRRLLSHDDVQVVAVCDADSEVLEAARQQVDNKYGDRGCAVYGDMNEMFARGDLDAVVISLPDHWHALAAIAALRAGLDVYGEKPIAHSLREGRAICEAVSRYGRVFQTGSQQRSMPNMHRAAELVRNGRIGRVTHIEVGLGGPHIDYAKNRDQSDFCEPPACLDYDRWLGPAPWAPYCPPRVHKNWRWVLDYGGGRLMDWVGHHADIAAWGVGLDETGPVQVEAHGEFPSGLWNAPTSYQIDLLYANGQTMRLSSQSGAVRWHGELGTLHVDRPILECDPAWVLNEVIGPNEIRLYRSTDHMRNFLDCVRSRARTAAPAEIGHRSASLGQLGMVAMLTGRKLRWDPAREEVIGDPGANAMLGRAWREPWTI